MTTNTVKGGPLAGAACCTACCAANSGFIPVIFLPCELTCIETLGVLPPQCSGCVLAFCSSTP